MSLLKENTKTKLCKKCLKKPRFYGRTLCLLCLQKEERMKRLQKSAKKKEREALRKLKRKEKRENSYKTVSKKAWNTFAKWLKKEKDFFTCYTCLKTLPIEESQAGHCFHRGSQRYRAIDFDPKHIHLQCGGCNCFSTGQTNIFQARLTRELGIEEVEKMIWRRNNEPPLTIEELKELIARYTVDN